jgi:hypothetical protein
MGGQAGQLSNNGSIHFVVAANIDEQYFIIFKKRENNPSIVIHTERPQALQCTC